MPSLIRGQHVQHVKVERSRELRRDMTPAEKLLWERLRGSQLDGLRWRRQQVIDGFIVDFYCHSATVVIELDGSVHKNQAEYDTARDDALAQRGLRILRFTNTDMETNIDSVLDQIRTTCQQRIHSK
ncbi:MAG TPA: DUF559 domain-containing protein [Ktedonobacterales bacterium]|jgi:very-short-patch-repair endonuclease